VNRFILDASVAMTWFVDSSAAGPDVFPDLILWIGVHLIIGL